MSTVVSIFSSFLSDVHLNEQMEMLIRMKASKRTGIPFSGIDKHSLKWASNIVALLFTEVRISWAIFYLKEVCD